MQMTGIGGAGWSALRGQAPLYRRRGGDTGIEAQAAAAPRRAGSGPQRNFRSEAVRIAAESVIQAQFAWLAQEALRKAEAAAQAEAARLAEAQRAEELRKQAAAREWVFDRRRTQRPRTAQIEDAIVL